MTTVPVTDTDRTLFAAIHRPCPGCRWCQTRRVLTVVWRVLDTASMVAMAVGRALLLCAAMTAVLLAVAHDYGSLAAVVSAGGFYGLCVAQLSFDRWVGHR